VNGGRETLPPLNPAPHARAFHLFLTQAVGRALPPGGKNLPHRSASAPPNGAALAPPPLFNPGLRNRGRDWHRTCFHIFETHVFSIRPPPGCRQSQLNRQEFTMATIAFLEPYLRLNEMPELVPEGADLVQALIMSVHRKIDQAEQAHVTGRLVEKGFYLGRATAVVDALRDVLDIESGGLNAQDFDRVYSHIDLCLQLSVTEEAPDTLFQAREAVCRMSACWQAASCKSSVLKGTA